MSLLANEGGPPIDDYGNMGGFDNYEASNDDLNACYQGPPIKWKMPFTLTESQGGISPSLHESYRRVLEEAEEIWLDRQGQYGMTPFATKPEILLSLVQVKLWRLEQDFAAEDGWLDLLNYAAIGLMVARGEWE